jgi:7-cyano-7-deazaguanine synthase
MATKGKNKAAVVLLSGGMDSAVAAAQAKAQGRRLTALTLSYGQRHLRELRAASAQARALGISRHQVLRIPLEKVASGALVDGSAIRRTAARSKAIPSTYVSFRNGVFLSLALSFAESLGAGEVWGGWCETDHAGYPDCRPAFFRAMEKAAALGTGAGSRGKRLKIVAPLAGLDKAATVGLGKALGVDFALTWTCYLGLARPCRRCDACRLRAEGFLKAGVADPLLSPT